MAYHGETLERALETLLQTNIAAALNTVEARWSAIDPVTLPDPANWSRGYRMFMLDLVSTFYPYVLTMITDRMPEVGQAGRLKMQDVIYKATISAFVVANTEDDVSAIAHRYLEAIIDILQASLVIGGFKQRHYEPVTRIVADNVVHLRAGDSGDPENAADVDYMRLVEVDIELEGCA